MTNKQWTIHGIIGVALSLFIGLAIFKVQTWPVPWHAVGGFICGYGVTGLYLTTIMTLGKK